VAFHNDIQLKYAHMSDTGRLKRATDALTSYVNIYWFALWVNTVLLICFLYWALTASNYVYTYLLPAGQAGTLTSQRWSGDFFCTGSLAALIILIMSGAWVAAHPAHGWGLTVHLVILLIGFIYYLCVVAFVWSFPLAKANSPHGDNAQNPANDPRYCCVNFNLGGCDNSPNPLASPPLPGYGCTPGVGQADLIINGVFLFKFCGLIVALVFMLIDGIYVGFILRGAVHECDAAIKAALSENGDTTTTTTDDAAAASSIRTVIRAPILQGLSMKNPSSSPVRHHQQTTVVPKLSTRIK